MEFKVTIGLNEETLAVLKALSGVGGTGSTAAPVKSMPSSNGSSKKIMPVKPVEEIESADTGNITSEMILMLMSDKSEQGHKDACKTILKEAGAKKLSELPKEKYAEVHEKLSGL